MTKQPRKKADVEHIDVTDISKYALDSGIINIDLKSIVPDPNQPRKFFNEQELQELAQSISQVGVIEPILVRIISDDVSMIVFGERRFRASVIASALNAEIQTIPCMIRELTDEQALELQITENLQRHDPHPIEEAASFEKMLKNHDIKEISVRVGRSEKFVAQRLSLNNLIPDFQEMFFRGCLDMKGAVGLSKLSAEDQNMILEEENENCHWKENPHYEFDNALDYVTNAENRLSDAPFDTTDATIHADMGACTGCKFNSANNLLLFDNDKKPVCSNSVCFNIKKQRSFMVLVEEAMTDTSIIFVAGYHYNNSDKSKVEAVKKMGIRVYNENEINYLSPESERPTYDSIKEEITDDLDYYFDDLEDGQEPTAEALEAKIQEDLADKLREWEEEDKELSEQKEKGNVRKAFMVVGNQAGKYRMVLLRMASVSGKEDSSSAATDSPEAQIEGIEKRETRAKELDAEKVWTEIFKTISGNDYASIINDGVLKEGERSAMAMAIYESLDYHRREQFRDMVGQEDRYRGTALAQRMEIITDREMNTLFRLLIASKLFPSAGSHLTGSDSYMGKKVAELYLPEEIKAIEDKQQQAVDKRVKRVNDRIAALRPQPAESQENHLSTAKKSKKKATS